MQRMDAGNRPAPARSAASRKPVARARAWHAQGPHAIRTKINGVARPNCAPRNSHKKARGRDGRADRGRTGRRRSSSDACCHSRLGAKIASASTAPAQGQGVLSHRRASRSMSSQSKRACAQKQHRIFRQQPRPAATPRPATSALPPACTRARQIDKTGAGDDGGHVRRRRQHLHPDHQGEIEQQGRERCARPHPSRCLRAARQTNQLASTDSSTPLTRTPNGVSPKTMVPARISQAISGRMIEIAGSQMFGPQPVIGFVGRERQNPAITGAQQRSASAATQRACAPATPRAHRARQTNRVDMA